MAYDQLQLQKIIEGAILASGEPISVDRIFSLFELSDLPEKQEIMEALTGIQEKNKDRGFQLVEVASGWRFQVEESLATWVNRLWEEKPQKYSRALLETLALIAYRQPITRGDIEEVRGVAVSSHIIKTLVERSWVKVVGHRDVPGRPSLYATTKQFLDYFNLKSLDELPSLGELQDIENLNETLEFEEAIESAKDALEQEAKDIAHEVDGELANVEEPSSTEMVADEAEVTESATDAHDPKSDDFDEELAQQESSAGELDTIDSDPASEPHSSDTADDDDSSARPA